MAIDRTTTKLAVILHADIASSTEMVLIDEHLSHHRIQDTFRRFSETIEEFRGQLLELRGDALLAEFERPSDAVAATLVFQTDHLKYLASLDNKVKPEIRAGIAMGEVVVADNTVTGAGVVMAQRVEQLAKAGGLCITSAVRESLSGRLPVEFQSLGERRLKGFDHPIKVYSVSLCAGKTVSPLQRSIAPNKSQAIWKQIGLLTTIIIMSAAGIIFWVHTNDQKAEPTAILHEQRPAIAVIPFINLSDNKAQEYFVDGITEDLITDLSKISGLMVASRSTVFTYKNKTIDSREIARKLGVQYILEGSVRTSSNQLRMNVQLVDLKHDYPLWAERYDRDMTEIFELQDDLTLSIVDALKLELSSDEIKRFKNSNSTSAEAYDFVLQARAIYKNWTPASNAKVIELYRKAVEIDPEFAQAWAELGHAFFQKWLLEPKQGTNLLRQGANYALKATEIDPISASVWSEFGFLEWWASKSEKAIEALRHAVELNPHYSEGWSRLSEVLTFAGRPDEGLQAILEARKYTSYVEPYWFGFYAGEALYYLGRNEEAIKELERAIDQHPGFHPTRRFMAAVLAETGRTEEARIQIQKALQLNPSLSINNLRQQLPFLKAVDLERQLDALELAGLPLN